MKRFLHLSILFVLLLSLQSHAQSVSLDWVGKMGGSGADAGNAIATDAAGNVYVTGNFTGTDVDFDPVGQSVAGKLTSSGTDVFVAKLNANGTLAWVKKLGGSSTDIGRAVAVDQAGNVYVAGTFMGTANFNTTGGTTELTSLGATDVFICKLNASGTLVWAKKAGGGGTEALWDLAVDPVTGSAYMTGSYFHHASIAVVFGPQTLTSNGSSDIFISKLDRDGEFKWTKGLGGTSADAGYGIALQRTTNTLVTTGNFWNKVGVAPGDTLTSTGNSDILVYKCDTNGNFNWAKKMGGNAADQPRDLALDAAGNIYTTGYFSDSANFDPNGNYKVYGEFHYQDIFVSKLTAAGNFVYAKGFGGPNMQAGSEEASKFHGEAIVTDDAGNAFVAGRIDYANVDFAPGPEVFYRTSKGNSDIFMLSLTTAGDLSWVRTFGAGGNDVANGIALDNTGNVHTTGVFFQTVNFNPNEQATPVNLVAGASDIFVHKMGRAVCTSSISAVVNEQACDSFRYAGVLYTTSRVFSALAVNAAGCDSMVTFNLTVGKSSVPSLYTPPAQCDTFEFFGSVYRQSGQYDQVLTNAAGCDSLVTIDLTIIHSSWDTLFRVTNCEGYTYDTTTYLETGFYVHTYPHSNGCDSNVVLSLTIDTVNVSVTADAEKLTTAEANAIWQWLDCDDQYAAIPGADSQSFTPQKSGNYAVAVTADGCTDTSICVPFSVPDVSSVMDGAGFVKWSLYPNPANTTLYMDISLAGKVFIHALDGRLISETVLTQGANRISIETIQSGVYTARITDVYGQTLGVQKFVKMTH